jgi:hypothetical protein
VFSRQAAFVFPLFQRFPGEFIECFGEFRRGRIHTVLEPFMNEREHVAEQKNKEAPESKVPGYLSFLLETFAYEGEQIPLSTS